MQISGDRYKWRRARLVKEEAISQSGHGEHQQTSSRLHLCKDVTVVRDEPPAPSEHLAEPPQVLEP